MNFENIGILRYKNITLLKYWHINISAIYKYIQNLHQR